MSRAEKQRRRLARKEHHQRQWERRQRMQFPDAFEDAPVIHLVSYDITEEPLNIEADPKLEAALADQREGLFDQVHDDPQSAIPRLQKWWERFPDSPLLLNWLSVAYGRAGMIEQYEQTIRLNYERNPNYLFAKVNYAYLELRAGHTERVAEILDHKFDLKLLYPWRNVFHVSEFIAFAGLMVEYHIRTGEIDIAKNLFDTMQQIAPDHEMTEKIGEILNSPIMTTYKAISAILKKDEERRARRLKTAK